VFFPDRVSKLKSTLYKMHCTLFEDNGKHRRQFRFRLEYSNVELQSAYGGLLLALYNYNGLVAPGRSLYNFCIH